MKPPMNHTKRKSTNRMLGAIARNGGQLTQTTITRKFCINSLIDS